MDKIFFAGFGDIARRISCQAEVQSIPQIVLTRDRDKAERLRTQGFQVCLDSFDDPENLGPLPLHGATVFYSVPPPGGGHLDTRVAAFCTQVGAHNCPQKLIYLSTSGVYGDCGDERVDESRPINPQTARAKRRADAESRLQTLAQQFDFPLIILRITGIYGPTRLPLHRLRQGHPLLRQQEAKITNRIHAEDLARVCVAAALKGKAGDIFNVSDGQQSSMTDYFNQLADFFDLPRPRQISRAEANKVMNPLMLSYIDESRRLDNRRMLECLGVKLLYPTLEAGLQACKKEMEQ